ncbi:hypothetical protein C0Q70_12257 [Pomacea canaliculata]|uniref:Uncharacterized protein n=1 Tax=Pomacea canaliculata TaxID=400727 RepID=A0A2T7P124_POMCA|nr:hypothetical protein C0Q70_12257 [Pomacea canaliculata]
MCDGERCISSHGQKIDVQRPNYSSSRLVSVNVTREWAGTVVCTERFTSRSEHSVNSTLDVYYNSGITDVSMVVNREDWTLITSFKVAKIFSALGNYGAKLNCTSLNSTVNMSLVPYNESSLVYNVGYFQLTSFKSQFDSHVNLTCLSTVVVYPGARLERLNERGGVKESSTPQIVCDLTYIPEDGPFQCSCDTESLGSPEGRLTWRLGEQVLTSGDYGVKRLPLSSDIINRSHQGEKLVCEVEWLYDKRSEINIMVACEYEDKIITCARQSLTKLC